MQTTRRAPLFSAADAIIVERRPRLMTRGLGSPFRPPRFLRWGLTCMADAVVSILPHVELSYMQPLMQGSLRLSEAAAGMPLTQM
jgi:hypothetical protein